LHDLAVWLTQERCPHYFINNCNLIDSSFNLDMIHRRLTSISKSWLASWFVDNYIRRCSQFCPHNVSRMFDDVSTTTKLQTQPLKHCLRIWPRPLASLVAQCLRHHNRPGKYSSRFLDRPLVTVNFRFSCECKHNRMSVKLLLILLVLLLLRLVLQQQQQQQLQYYYYYYYYY